MSEIDTQKLIDINYRCLMLLGYSVALISDYRNSLDASKRNDRIFEKCDWLIKSAENVIYFDKPLPPCP